MLLTIEQLHEIRDIIRRYHSAFIVNTIGPTAVPKEVLDKLQEAGLVNVKANSIEDAYLLGQVASALNDPKLNQMSYDELKAHLKKNPIPLSQTERQSIDFAKDQAAQYVQGLGNKIELATGQLLIEADTALRAKLEGEIQNKTEENIAKRESVKKLKSEMGKATDDWARDWDRIAITEKHNAMQRGLADGYRKQFGNDVLVAKRPMPDACKHCVRLHLGPDGQPRIFKLSTLEDNGTNVGRKAQDWLPVVGAIHPHCGCQLIRIPDGYGFDEDGTLVPGGKLGQRYEDEEDIERSLKAETDLLKAFKLQGHTEFQGIPIAIENKAGSKRKWKDDAGNEGESTMLYAYGYVEGTSGNDIDEIDVFIGPDPRSKKVFVVHQSQPHTGLYDEDKCFLGFCSESDVRNAYLQQYDSKGPTMLQSVSELTLDQFKRWVNGTGYTEGHGLEMVPEDDQPRLVIPLQKAQLYIGPRGGKWADPKHTIPWKPEKPKSQSLLERVRRHAPGKGGEIDLSRKELRTLLKDGKYALISAGPNPNIHEDKNMTDAQRKARHEKLRKQLVADGYMFTQVVGHYGGLEDSFLVMVHDADKEHIKELGKKYHQDSVIYSDHGKHQMFFTTGEKAGKHLYVPGEGHDIIDHAVDFFTEYKHPDGTKTKFTLNFNWGSETIEKSFVLEKAQKVIAIGKRGGKIVGYKGNKPIYARKEIEKPEPEPKKSNDLPDSYPESGPIKRGMNLQAIEDAIRDQPIEHLGVVAGNVQLFRNVGSEHACAVPPDAVRRLQEHYENSVFTHNHPNGGILSNDDIHMAVVADVKEMRAALPTKFGGGAWVIKRPESGTWGVWDKDRSADMATNERVWLNFLKSVEFTSVGAARRDMDAYLEKWNADNGTSHELGPDHPGFTQRKFDEFVSKRRQEQFNERAKKLGYKFEIRFEAAQVEKGNRSERNDFRRFTLRVPFRKAQLISSGRVSQAEGAINSPAGNRAPGHGTFFNYISGAPDRFVTMDSAGYREGVLEAYVEDRAEGVESAMRRDKETYEVDKPYHAEPRLVILPDRFYKDRRLEDDVEQTLDWLKRVKREKTATGGIVNYTQVENNTLTPSQQLTKSRFQNLGPKRQTPVRKVEQ